MNQTSEVIINSILHDGVLLKTEQSHNGAPVVIFNPDVSRLCSHPDFLLSEAQDAEQPEEEKPFWHS